MTRPIAEGDLVWLPRTVRDNPTSGLSAAIREQALALEDQITGQPGTVVSLDRDGWAMVSCGHWGWFGHPVGNLRLDPDAAVGVPADGRYTPDVFASLPVTRGGWSWHLADGAPQLWHRPATKARWQALTLVMNDWMRRGYGGLGWTYVSDDAFLAGDAGRHHVRADLAVFKPGPRNSPSTIGYPAAAVEAVVETVADRIDDHQTWSKLASYAALGIEHVWIVYFADGTGGRGDTTITALRLTGGTYAPAS